MPAALVFDHKDIIRNPLFLFPRHPVIINNIVRLRSLLLPSSPAPSGLSFDLGDEAVLMTG